MWYLSPPLAHTTPLHVTQGGRRGLPSPGASHHVVVYAQEATATGQETSGGSWRPEA